MPTNPLVTIEATIHAPIDHVWKCWTEPSCITQWNHASDDWHSPAATNDLREGGTFSYRMEAKDGSVGFDFGGTYTQVEPKKVIAYVMEDKREVKTTFEEQGDNVKVTTVFETETENPIDMQKQGWLAILENFKKHTESCPQK